ncbi:tetratricopeptide repeat protein [Azospirillum sp. SYSU D00513]|uniref:tetratricopeptide repeat protein n=1 Tax=Azospirillum sp. SYSU D00513 TaxID=2812561 RepID=UPI001FFE457E|nr:tetratricopeptide repeat protein [Azospirillum sp. SYSU D00513]
MKSFRNGRAALAAAFIAALGGLPSSGALAAGAGTAPVVAPVPERPMLSNVTGSYLAGRFAQRQDDWKTASQYLAHALSANPEDLSLLRQTYLLKLGEGQTDAALSYAKRLVGKDPDPQMALILLVADHLNRGRLEEAAALAARMPDQGMAKYFGPLIDAWLLMARGDAAKASEELSSLSDAPGFTTLQQLHSGLIQDLADNREAAARHYAALTETQAPLRVVQIVGNFFERNGRVDEARALYERFKASNPESLMMEPALKALGQGKVPARIVADARQGMAEALFDLASALHQEGAEETALLFGRVALHLRPDLTLARFMIGDIMDARDLHAEALAEYQGLASDPMLGWAAKLHMAESLTRLKRTDEAIALLTQLAGERPERTDALVRLGDLYRSAERYEEAAATYSKALERIGTPEQRHWALLYTRAVTWEKLDRWPQAEADLQQALALNPDEPLLLNYLGYSWVDRGLHLDKGRAMVERAVELRPRDGYIIDSLGWALYRMGEFEQAVTTLERAVELKPVDPTINDHLGDAYWRVGRRNEARFQWNRALRIAEEEPLKEQIRAKLEKGLADRQAAEAERPKQP